MDKTLTKLSVLMMCAGLAACASYSSYEASQTPANTSSVTTKKTNVATRDMAANTPRMSGGSVGGHLRREMDESDRSKLSHALDKSPGKVTHWVNQNSNTSYTVVSTRVLTINGNSHCRKYNVTAETSGHTEKSSGTACVDTDGSWKAAE